MMMEQVDKGNNVIQIDQEIAEFWDCIDTLTVMFEDLGFLKWLKDMSDGKPLAFRNSSSNMLISFG